MRRLPLRHPSEQRPPPTHLRIGKTHETRTRVPQTARSGPGYSSLAVLLCVCSLFDSLALSRSQRSVSIQAKHSCLDFLASIDITGPRFAGEVTLTSQYRRRQGNGDDNRHCNKAPKFHCF